MICTAVSAIMGVAAPCTARPQSRPPPAYKHRIKREIPLTRNMLTGTEFLVCAVDHSKSSYKLAFARKGAAVACTRLYIQKTWEVVGTVSDVLRGRTECWVNIA